MKVAAYQAPLLAVGSMAALQLIQQRVKWCEEHGIEILCCPEAILEAWQITPNSQMNSPFVTAKSTRPFRQSQATS
ncbi:MAG TPA: hypothetical protein VF074_24070 [Pyrinomonadaceae bacterium]